MSVFEDMGDWAYCAPCHRYVLMSDESDLLPRHETALLSDPCRGSGERPWKVPAELTPEEERKAIEESVRSAA